LRMEVAPSGSLLAGRGGSTPWKVMSLMYRSAVCCRKPLSGEDEKEFPAVIPCLKMERKP
jgi:hypothetical protein